MKIWIDNSVEGDPRVREENKTGVKTLQMATDSIFHFPFSILIYHREFNFEMQQAMNQFLLNFSRSHRGVSRVKANLKD